MSFGTMSGHGPDTTSALRIGLTGLKPIKVREVIKRYGIKFQTIYTSYELDTEITSFEEFSTLRYNQIFNNIKIPEYFDIEKLTDFYATKAIEKYNEDKEYKKMIEETKRTRGSIGPFIDFVKYVKDRYKGEIDNLYKVNANNFYNSDLPLSVFNDFSRTDHLFANFLNLLHHTLNYYDRKIISTARGNQIKFNRLFEEMKGELDNNFDLVDEMIFDEKCLQRLMIIWNANSYKELDDIESIKLDNIPKNEFNKWYFNLKKSIRISRINILNNRYYREDDTIDVLPPQIQYNSQELLKNIFYQDDLRIPEWNPR